MNILDLVLSLPESQLVGIVLQDNCYDRSLQYKGIDKPTIATRLMLRGYRMLNNLTSIRLQLMDIVLSHFAPVDQTLQSGVLAQIQCIARKLL
jgi:DNA integrity scanning protein DisA with diadenylate cyclase activity